MVPPPRKPQRVCQATNCSSAPTSKQIGRSRSPRHRTGVALARSTRSGQGRLLLIRVAREPGRLRHPQRGAHRACVAESAGRGRLPVALAVARRPAPPSRPAHTPRECPWPDCGAGRGNRAGRRAAGLSGPLTGPWRPAPARRDPEPNDTGPGRKSGAGSPGPPHERSRLTIGPLPSDYRCASSREACAAQGRRHCGNWYEQGCPSGSQAGTAAEHHASHGPAQHRQR